MTAVDAQSQGLAVAAGASVAWEGVGAELSAAMPMPTVRKKGAGGYTHAAAHARQSPPGWFGPGAQPVARRFPGHFAPHRLCNHFSTQGWCRKAEACTFAHGMQELHPDVQMQLAPQMGYDYPGMFPTSQLQTVTACRSQGGSRGKDAGRAATAVAAEAGVVVEHGEGAADCFKFNVAAQPFVLNVAAQPFVPPGAEVPNGEAASPPKETPISSSKRRQAPSPLTTEDLESPAVVSTMALPTVLSPAKLVQTSPRVVTTSRPLLLSPKAVLLSPSGNLCAAASSVATGALVSPTSPVAAKPGLAPQSPACGTILRSPLVLLSPSGARVVSWPASPASAVPWPGSPIAGTPVAIPRERLLQARTVVKRLEQGPPGLAHCAPTPTTKAGKFGFQYPQPGWISSRPLVPPAPTVQ